MIRHGLDRPISLPRGLRPLAELFDRFSFQQHLKETFNWVFVDEHARLTAQLEALRARLNAPVQTTEGAPITESVSTRVLDLKQEITREEADLRQLRLQLSEQQKLISALDERLKLCEGSTSAEGEFGLGLLDRAECPTCHQYIEPNTYNLSLQSKDAIAAYVETLERVREPLRGRSLTRARK